MRRGSVLRRRSTAALALLALVPALAACGGEDGFAEDYAAAPDQGYVAGDGSFEEIPVEGRSEPVDFSGTTQDGAVLDGASLRGEVAVVNFWYASCAPCRVEAPDLANLSREYEAEGVRFVGVNVYDQAATIESFDDRFGIPYPSILDVEDAKVRLAFADNVPPQAIPSTLVLDRSGSVAAVIRGPLDRSVLEAMLDRVVGEAAG